MHYYQTLKSTHFSDEKHKQMIAAYLVHLSFQFNIERKTSIIINCIAFPPFTTVNSACLRSSFMTNDPKY